MISLFDKFREFLKKIFTEYSVNELTSVDYMVALPNPLDADEEAKLLKENSEGSTEAFKKLKEHN